VIFAGHARVGGGVQPSHRRCDQRDRLRHLRLGELHEASRRYGAREARDDAAVETFLLEAADHRAIDSSGDFVSQNDGGKHVLAARAGLLGNGE
jgi:hypothetical protein